MSAAGLELLRGWLPGRVFWGDLLSDGPQKNSISGQTTVEWLRCDDQRFGEPSLDGTFQNCLRRPFNSLFRHRTPLATLEAWAAASPGVPPTGFIFHASRGDAAMLSNSFGVLPSALMLSEPGPVDQIIRANGASERLTQERQISTLRALVSALGQRRAPEQDRLFVKFDAWHTRQLPLVRAAFPKTPWIFLYRDPLETLVSALQERETHTTRGILHPALFGLADAAANMAPGEYCARVLASLYEAGLCFHASGGGLLINATQLPAAAWTTVPEWFGCSLDANDVAALQTQADRNPQTGPSFEENSGGVCPAVRELAARWMQPIYDRLEAARTRAA